MKQETIELIESAVASNTLSKHFDLIEVIFDHLGLSAFYNLFVKHVSVSKQQRANVLAIPTLSHSFRLVLNVYEGSMREQCDKKEQRLLVITALFLSSGVMTFKKLYEELPEEKKLTHSDFVKICFSLSNLHENSKIRRQKILHDAIAMHLYEDGQTVMHHDFIEFVGKKNKELWPEPIKSTLDELYNEFLSQWIAFPWKTNWARKKAFFLNYPEVVKTAFEIFKKNNKAFHKDFLEQL